MWGHERKDYMTDTRKFPIGVVSETKETKRGANEPKKGEGIG